MEHSERGIADLDASKFRIPDHELIREVAGGAYGTVWLARNAAGTLRAVKIVERASFESDRPHEREYEGLKRFEPLSREHDGLVDILHLGRNDAEGYFFYVMEAADDLTEGQQIDPAKYVPRTLAHEVGRRKRLPVAECVEISLALSDAVGFLHKAGLVHRDLKPSNIIFVNGKPKIADVGTVAREGYAKTQVGSTGFIPPEGPGKAQGDLYSLGILMYEMAMGKGHEEFPMPPTELQELPDRKALIRLNEVISKAADPDVRRRYRSAGELKKDLLIVKQGGRPNLVHLQRTWARVLVIAGILGISALWYFSAYKLRVVHSAALPQPAGKARAAFTTDWFGTGESELIYPLKNSLCIFSHPGRLNAPIEIDEKALGELVLSCVQKADGRAKDTVFASWAYGEGLNTNEATPVEVSLVSIDQHGYRSEPFKCAGTGFVKADFGVTTSVLCALRITDLEGKGRFVLLAALHTAWANGPRGLWCFDYETRQANWFFRTAGYVSGIDVVDLDGDRRKEIVVGTLAPSNGNAVVYSEVPSRAFHDSRSHLFVVSSNGDLLKWRELGPEHSNVTPVEIGASVGRRQNVKIVATVSENNTRTNGVVERSGRVLVFDAEMEAQAAYDVGTAVVSCRAADLEDGERSLLISDADGFVHLLDATLKPRFKRLITPRMAPPTTNSHTLVELKIVDVGRFTGGDETQVILTSSLGEQRGNPFYVGNAKSNQPSFYHYDDSVLILDKTLRLVAKHRVSDRRADQSGFDLRAFAISSYHGPEILVFSDKAEYLKLARW